MRPAVRLTLDQQHSRRLEILCERKSPSMRRPITPDDHDIRSIGQQFSQPGGTVVDSAFLIDRTTLVFGPSDAQFRCPRAKKSAAYVLRLAVQDQFDCDVNRFSR